MRNIEKAGITAFKLVFSKNTPDTILIEKTGRICVHNRVVRLDYENNRETIGWIENSRVIIRTLHQNVLPLYARVVGGEVWVSNDVSELLIPGEVVPLRRVELLLAAAGSEGIRTASSHLLEDIRLLMSLSRYQITFPDGDPLVAWSDIDFELRENATKEGFLDFLIGEYRKAYEKEPEICFAISGGWDSRLELAILTHLKKQVHCYHSIISKRESEQARRAAEAAGASFRELPYEELVLPGWDFLGQQGYLTRWDGFFAPGALYSAGLYLKIREEHPDAAVRILSSLLGWKGRLYEHSTDLLDYWLHREENYFSRCRVLFPEHGPLLIQEQKRRQDIVSRLIPAIYARCGRRDIAVDISYIILAKSRLDTRVTFLIENGMPVFDGMKDVRDFFISLPEKDKEQPAFPEWAIGKLNPGLKEVPHTTSSMKRTEREFGPIGRIRWLGEFLGRFSKMDRGYGRDWFQDADVLDIFALIPEIRQIAERARDDRPRLYIAQICRFLKAVQEKKKVSFRIVE